MNLTDLIESLSAKNVELWVDGDNLRYRGSEKILSPELLAQIKQYKPEIIRLLSQSSYNGATYPLSHGQKALWFLYQLAPRSLAYNSRYAAKLVVNLDIPALKQAAQALIERHPVLRTTFTTIDGEPVQTVHKNQQVYFSVENAFALELDEVNNWLLQTSACPFDLEHGPILRFNLLINHTKTKEYILLITQHHIGSDFWSGEIILSELRDLYEAITLDKEPLLLEQNCQYRDYVKLSEQMLSGELGERLWNYWQQQLCGELPVLSMPTDRPRQQSQTYNGADYFFSVSETLLQKLTELASRERASLYMVLLTALQILLLRYTSQEDILIGSPMMNRSRPEFEKIVGYFTNPVVLRANLSGDPTFQELLGRSRLCVLDALEHQDYPFPLLVERLQPVRDPSISPLYQVAFAWDRSHPSNTSMSLMDSDGLFVESMSIGTLGAAFDLTLTILHASSSLKGTWNYNTDLFDSSTIERMAQHYVTLLSAIVDNPQQRIDQLPLLTQSEQQQLLVEWNDTKVDYACDKCIHHLFEEQVERTPDAVAVVFDNQQLTYGELNCRSNQLAHYLRSLGVRASVLVGISVERSLEMVVGLLGILKAGGAYVPLDPGYPTERLRFMLLDAQISVLLTQQSLEYRLKEQTAQLVCLDTEGQEIWQSSQDNLITEVQATNLAYVIYTSGSTGQPKGVEVIHRGVNRLLFGVNYVELNATQRFLQMAPISFDASTFEIWGALLNGARLFGVSKELALSPENFAAKIREQGISALFLTTALFNQIAQAVPSAFNSLRYLLFGGEAVDPQWVQEVLKNGGPQQLLHVYGPTENTTFTSWYLVQDVPEDATTIPIGRPIANTQVYILDKYLQPVPVGVPGELHIGGAGLARGYLNRPDLTVEKFIDNPFDKSRVTCPESKLYKTGDKARYLPSGNIEYLGRIDFQVKIRGFRIELGEIEATLNQLEDVQSSVVMAREDTPGNKRLVAYIVLHTQVTPKISSLRRLLTEKLPEYMVPNAFVLLEALPLTPNGKVDRRALPTPDIHSLLQEKYVAPRTPTEEMLALLWGQVLKVEHVGIHDNFFSLGGHSLLATQLVSRIRNIFKVEVPLGRLFTAATVAELAHSIQQLQLENIELTDTDILPRTVNAELPLSFAQQRLWFLDQLQPLSASYNIPMSLRLVGNLNVAALQQSLNEIIQRHEALRTNLLTVDGKATQLIHTVKNCPITVVDLQHLAWRESEKASVELAQLLAIQPFDLSCDALLRATLVVLSNTEHVLNVCMHHVVSDGWSMGVLVTELTALYNAYSIGQPSPLVPLPIQYADFALWQRQWLQAEVLQSQLNYWRGQLAGAPTFLPLPTDRPRGAVQTFPGAYYELALSVELTQKLTKLSTEQGVTLFMTLLTGFKTLLYRYTGQTDILVGSPIANRHHREIEGLIGFFVNTLVMRTDLSGNPSFSELLPRTRSMALSAYAHQDLPLEMLVEALQPQRDLSHTPLFQVMFALQNAPMSDVELSGLSVSLLPLETATARFDLTLSIENTQTGLVCGWEYNTDLFDSSTIERMASHFRTLLSAIVDNPQQKISQLPLLTASEQQQLLVEWNDTRIDDTHDLCIPDLFVEQVARIPDAVAVVYEDQQLTYQQLNSRANQLAHYLRFLGVGTDVLVGICVERSLEMMVGLLGILKAGGAYVPLDPEYPTERLSFMLEDAQVRILLTQQHLVAKLPQHTAQQVCLDTQWHIISQFTQDNLTAGVQATDLAYVIYTSGSTGTPKGVLIAHEGLLNLVAWHQRTFQITDTDKATQMAGTGFDAAVWEIWPYLTAGASIHLVKSEILTSPVDLREWLISHQISIAFVPTPVAQELLSLSWTVDVALRYMLIGGDQLASYPSVSLPFPVVNNYGPTENTVVTTSGVVVAQQHEHRTPSIGRPIANTQVYILDSNLQPVPIGVPGELHISGMGLARGYLNRPDLTLEKFIPNPFDNSLINSHSAKLYKTGDLARYLPSGNIEYLGRIDNQVKIRGFRIELGEIEAVLSQLEHVQSVVVVARVDIPGKKRLVAYIVPHPQLRPTISQLRQYLKTKLPDYMVPGAIVILESLPLTANGKIDKSALPVPNSHTEIVGSSAPRTPVEAKLVQIWAQVLRVPLVGIHDNFFSLGGDSILSIQIIAKAKLAGIELSLKQLFANQTIAELATVAGTTQALAIEQELVTGTLPLTPIQHWFFAQDLAQPHHFNQSFLLTVPSDIKLEFLEQVWQQLLLHHDALRLRFTETDGTWQQIHGHPTQTIEIPCFDLSTVRESELHTEIENTANSLQASLNLSDNLVQVALFKLGDYQARLLIVIHHLVVDGVSWRILLEDLLTAYSQLETGNAIQLQSKTTSFKDWGFHLLEYAQSHRLKSELAYWLSTSNSEASPIPLDYATGVNTVASTDTVSVSLTEAQTHSLLQDVPKAYKTQINDILLTALVLVLSSWTHSKSVLFNLEGHGREDIIDGVDLSRTVGWFTTIFPVVLKLEAIDRDNIGQALKSVKEQLRAIPFKGIGYGLLRYLNEDPQISTQLQTIPTAQISFNYLGQFTQVLNTPSVMQLATEKSGQSQSLQSERSSLLDINAIIANEQLQIDWTYSSHIHQHSTIENLAFEFVETLRSLIAHCLSKEHGGYTPTDFPLIKLNQLELDGVLARLALKPERQSHWQNIEEIYPLSPMQEGMLFESLSAPSTGVYFEQIICTFTGLFNVEAFKAAWQQVVARHSIFRTAFLWESLSQPVQIVYRQVQVSVDTLDWRELSKLEQQAQLETFLDSERQQGLQLEQAPLMRLYLLQMDENTYQFIWCHHHILLDGWSLPLVFQDLLEYYQAISQGTSLALKPTISYRNYIAWLQQQHQDQAREFWRQKLQGFSAPTPLTVDKPLSNRSDNSSYSEQVLHLTPSTTEKAVSFVRQHQLTMNNLVQATWGLLLSRYSEETDVVFGATVSGRPPALVGVESMVGLFINTLPVRMQISDNSELLSLLKDLQAQQVESEQFSFFSLVEIQGVSDVPRGTSLFESIVVFENYPVDTAVIEDNSSFSISNFRGIERTNYPLTVIAIPGEQLSLKVSYDTSRFEHETISRMLEHYVTLLSAIVDNPQQRIDQLPLLTQSEQQQLLVEWNDTKVDYACDKCIHHLFEDQVVRTPDAVAVVFDNQQLTYGELNSRANQLADYLRSLGVKADVLVGICVERSLSMIVGLLGILKAGGAYVPLDPEYPTERLSFMLSDAQVSVLLTQQHLVEKLPEHSSHLVYLDTEHHEFVQTKEISHADKVKPSNLAYVLYTSGSTGRPKAVAIEHQSPVALVSWAQSVFTHKELAGVLASTSICFDLSVFELFVTLSVGGKVIIAQNALHLSSMIARSQVTLINTVPSALAELIREQDLPPLVCTVNLAGEALQNQLVQQIYQHSKAERVFNLYGPSEDTTYSTYSLIEKGASSSPTIGRPIANTQIYILDQYLQPVPVGVPGELHIGGAGLARGYLNRPDLTVEKFIDNPFFHSLVNCPLETLVGNASSLNGGNPRTGLAPETNTAHFPHSSKLYKTGDKARYWPSGNIEYLGRIDNQVKIRGFRIELGEIEAVLSQIEGVQTSCVIACVDTPGDQRLVAYIVPQLEQTLTVSQVRQFLKAKLPQYMLPSAIVILESLPLTLNGKVDRRALRAAQPSRELSDKYAAPRTPTEEMLALLWGQVLKVEHVGIHDNFFSLGGHSLLATQLVSRIRNIFKVEVPLGRLFTAATVAELAHSIQQLQLENIELTDTDILPRTVNAELPLSFAQQRLWFLDQLQPLSASYNIPMSLRLVGNLNVAALQQSLNEIIQRHEALRTNFITVDGKATQLIHTTLTNCPISVVDLQHLPWRERERASVELGQLLAIQPFDLSCDALLRATLVVHTHTEHLLNVCMHHVVSDGWSMGVFITELAALYNVYSISKPSPLEPLPIQYADFALWQRKWLAGVVLQRQLGYWQQQLAGAPTVLPLPTDRPRGAVQTFPGAYHELALSVELTQKLTKLSTEQGVTLFMTLLAGFNTLLYRYTGQTDILVGSPIANRHHREIEGLIGFFVNTLVMRTDLSGNPSFSELLPRTRSMALSAYAHQDLPLEMLVEALQPQRDLSHTPLFQVMFALQNAPMSDVELSGLSVSLLPLETATARFDLTLSIENTQTGLVCGWEYNTDLFDSSTIERMASHFRTLLSAIVDNPLKKISQLPLLTASEKQQLLVEWNDTRIDDTYDLCIPNLFEEQVARTPDAVAVVAEEQQLTYQQLNSRANQLAHYLRSTGVKANVLVGICVERSLEMMVGLLGILKAGGAYVPLDPEYPTERLSNMIQDAQVRILLTQQHLVEKLPQHTAQQVCLDSDWQLISQFTQDNLTTGVQVTDLAYVIYTSGSTGTPKGVLIAYEGLLNLVAWHQRTFQITDTDKATQMAGTGFDAAVWEIWPYLTAGASIHLVKSEILTSPVDLREWLISHQISIAFVPTPVAQELLSLSWTVDVALRYMLIGGDQLASYPSVSLPFPVVNNYGPTENTVVTTSGVVVAQQHEHRTPSIGRPIANTQVYILDSNLQPVPIGVPGELHISGMGLARGYLNRPDLTVEKFIPNPFSRSKGALEQGSQRLGRVSRLEARSVGRGEERLYKTGDLARYLPSGNIEYLGRIDFQVKIRGFRIELGEIEAVLSQHEHVQSVVVITREDIPGKKRLVAYIVPHPQVRPTISQLRQYLKTKLPDYMVPGAIVILESLPLTANGKIDKSALPVPDSRTQIEASSAPRTPVEAKLAVIWEQVLLVPLVGIHDNFFSLGGDSILSIQIIAKAKLAGIELSLKQLFANQTIAELATVAGTTKALAIEQGLVSGTLPLTPIQHWFFEQNLAQPYHFNQSFLLTLPSNFKPEILQQVWQHLLSHHDALRLRFTQTDGTWQQIHAHPTQTIEIPCFDLSTVALSELHTEIETTANSLQASLNLSENLVQVALFRLGDYQARLLIVIHHLVVDGVSWRILLEDLLTAYSQLETGNAIQLQSKTTSFKDWAFALAEYAQSDVLKSELAYWLSASHAAVAPIPVDYIVRANTVATANTVSVSLNEAETLSLLLDVPKAYKTQINDVLLTALVLVVSKWTHSDSVLFNLEGHGREDIIDGVDLSRTVGWFTTIFPVHVELSTTDKQHLGTALKSVKEKLRLIPHKGISYGILRYLSSEPEIVAQLQTLPLAEISFNYLGQFTQVLNTSSVFQLATESSGNSHSLQGQRSHLLDINAIITNERLQIDWTYSSNVHQQSTIENIALEFVETLRELIIHCLSPENGGCTPTDFPLVKFDQLELDQVFARLTLKPDLGKTNRQNIEDIYPLSPMQQGMLFETLYAPNRGVYFELLICTMKGNVDVPAFNAAWQQVVARHSIFRTAVIWEFLSQPLQVVYWQVNVTLLTIDWRELSVNQQQQQLKAFIDLERQQGLQLEQAPLMRLYLIQLSEDTYEFVWSFHHLLLDGWSSALVFKELLNFYQTESQEKRLPLQPVVSYRNYIAWLEQQDLVQAEEFWRQKLQGFSAPTPMTVDKLLPRRKNGNISYGEQRIQLTVPATAATVSFARQHQLTINNLVQATWALLLCRYSSLTDVVFGVTVSGRPPALVGVESIVGLLINTMPMRVQISQETKLLDLLKDLQAQQLDSEQFSFFPLVEIQGVSDVPRDTSLFESIVVFENYPVDTAAVEDNGSLTLSNFRGIEQTNYPLTVTAIPGEQLLLKVSYDTSRFEDGTIGRMLEHFVTMLSSIVANPQQRIDQLPMLTGSESQQLLVEWNDTKVDYAFDKCIHHLFEEQVVRTPDAVAVVFDNQQLTYTELNCRANQLAHYLCSLGVGADVLVGICVERSLFMVIGLLAILKADGAYVPLDPEYPTERLSFMLSDAQVSVLLTQEHLVESLPQHQVRVVHLDTDWYLICESSQKSPITKVGSDNLAYVIYTSGSTGQPKGVMLSHSNLCNHMFWMQATFPLTEKDKVLQKTPFGFDASVWEFYAPLLTGGQLLIAEPGGHTDSAYLLRLIAQQQVTTVQLVPSLLQMLLEQGGIETCHSLKQVFCGGEVLPMTLLEGLLSKLNVNFYNLYGPTEACIDATTWNCHQKMYGQSVPIGRPIANTQIYILDQYLQPVPIGVPGELHIGGAGLARGYLNRIELTAEKFIPNPFDTETDTAHFPHSSKLYKTGDLARYLPDGNIEYLGRIDNQVKIRGFRIELGEIEAVLRQHEDVQASCVIVREDTPGDQRLVAYIVPQPQVIPTLSILRSFLKEKLPNHMVPSAIIILESLPLTVNGKIDLRALPTPESRTREVSLVAPRTSVEARLAQIWAQVLKVELVGINDNFFEIGGHSLLATQVMSRLQEAFGTSLPLRCLFESPTIAELSEVILAQLQTGSGLTVPAIVPVSSRQDIPLSWAQERLWFMHQIEGESGAYTMSFTVRLVGDLNIKALEQAFQSMVQRHEVLRTRFESKNNLPVQVIVPNITRPLAVVDLQQVPDPWKQVKELATQEAAKPFDLVHDSVLRVKMWQVSPQEYILLVAIHHIAADGWSMGIFIRDLSAYYRAITTDSSVELPELHVQYADFTIWQRQWLTDQILERQLNYWMQQLAGTPPLLALPTDRSRPAIQTFRGGTQQLQLDGLLTQQLKKLSQKYGTTLFMTLLAGFVVLMSRYSGQKDLVVGSPIANRNRTEIEPLIGFFVNTLALRFYLSPEQLFEALLTQVQQVTQNAYDHQDLPFEMLVEHLELERNLDRNPLVQVMFALQNAPTSPWELPGLRVEEMPLGLDSVRFDLEIHLWDLPEGLEGVCCYNKDLFDGATIVRMMQHFQTLLAAIVANPQQPVALLPLLTQHENHQILVEWNNTQADYPKNQCIHQLFEEQVHRTPDAVAVVFENQQLTYGELNCRANQLAHYLQSLGVSADVLVGICVKRSVDMVVGLLGILKAGGAYVPLDPEYPTERLALIIEDAQISVLLTTDKLADALPKHQARVICYNQNSAEIALQSEENPTLEVRFDCLAYVIYTSGSTGKPKGVSVTHRGVNRLVINTNYIHIEPLDVIAQASNYAFDAATFEIWGALLNGARLFGVSKELALSPENFAAKIREQGISALFLTTALFNQIAQAVPSAFNSLRYLLFGGEAVDPQWVQEVLKNGGPQQLLHVYGPTENTTFTSWYLVQDVPKDATTIPIGRPIANTLVYILDSDMQPVPVGVPGELHIGGAGLARGYLNARELTQQKFIPNPFSGSKEAEDLESQRRGRVSRIEARSVGTGEERLYKTGDLARYLPDGNIEYLGRIDNQVKIRGFRIELGEIETVLNQHPLVQESVVVTRSVNSGDQSLVAYLVPGSKSQVLPQQFAQWQSEYFSDWQTLYEQTYGQTQASTDDLTFNIAGWNSSYTRQPIPEREMREWVESTVSRIMTLLPQRVLEIGCGTGLLLSRIAKGCQQYCGTDYSIAAIKHVEQVCATVESLKHVRLLHQMADNFAGIPQGEFDTVILNSIVQYFPSVEYLLEVLEGAMATIGTQGKIFVGDVRSLPLLEPYYAAVQLSQAAESIRIEQWQQQVHQSIAAEEELVIDPRFFITLKQNFPQITWVEIQPKRGESQNELTQFRYDVTLHLGTAVQTTVVPWLNWQLDQLSCTRIYNQLLSEQPQLLGIRAVPNQRVQQALQLWQWLEHPPSVETVGQMRELLAKQPTAGINPEQFWQLGQNLGYTVDLSWWGSSHDGSYDVVFCRNSSTPTSNPRYAIAFWNTEAVTAKPWSNYTNNPLHGKLVQKLVPQVREFIQQKLPNYMVPQAFVLLNSLPLTPNGKVDRRSLPTPDTASRTLSTGFVSPRTPIEAQLTKIWIEVLGLEPIGVKDNFFEIGGHSLLATQVISRINSAFALDLSVQKMFEFPTVAGIASYMEVMDWATTDLPVDQINAEIVEF